VFTLLKGAKVDISIIEERPDGSEVLIDTNGHEELQKAIDVAINDLVPIIPQKRGRGRPSKKETLQNITNSKEKNRYTIKTAIDHMKIAVRILDYLQEIEKVGGENK
jgi:RNA:NAD 2'-phosphotransferase (TPT1/KptA family)